MALYDEVLLSDLDKKARDVFGDHVVVKSLAQQAALHGLPRYVSEYLIAKYVKPESWQEDLAKVQAKIKELLPDLCTDEDLVINGQKFGKRWKHGVRTAQVYLRRGGRIYLEDGVWKLVPNGAKNENT